MALDRWDRTVTDLLTTLQGRQHFRRGFVSLIEVLCLTTPTGRAMAGLRAVFRSIATLARRGI
jgi:hypothetical protein